MIGREVLLFAGAGLISLCVWSLDSGPPPPPPSNPVPLETKTGVKTEPWKQACRSPGHFFASTCLFLEEEAEKACKKRIESHVGALYYLTNWDFEVQRDEHLGLFKVTVQGNLSEYQPEGCWDNSSLWPHVSHQRLDLPPEDAIVDQGFMRHLYDSLDGVLTEFEVDQDELAVPDGFEDGLRLDMLVRFVGVQAPKSPWSPAPIENFQYEVVGLRASQKGTDWERLVIAPEGDVGDVQCPVDEGL